MNRRNFNKLIGATVFLPAFIKPSSDLFKVNFKQEQEEKNFLPDDFFGRKLSDDEKIWLEKFSQEYQKSRFEIRKIDLPVELYPAFIPKYPIKVTRSKTKKNED